MDGPEKLETKVESKGEPAEAAAEIEPAEDERKLQTKLFVKLRVWRPKG